MPTLDTFDRADNLALGSPWVEEESASGVFRIVSNRLRIYTRINGSAEGGYARYNQELNADQRAELVLKAITGVAWSGVACRIDPGGGEDLTGYTATYVADATDPNIRLQRWEAWAPTQLGSSYFTTLSADDVLGVEAIGTTIRALVNGSPVIEQTDNAINSGQIGVVAIGLTGSGDAYIEWDDFGGAGAENVVGRDFPYPFAIRGLVGADFPYPYGGRLPAGRSLRLPFAIGGPIALSPRYPFGIEVPARNWVARLARLKTTVKIERP